LQPERKPYKKLYCNDKMVHEVDVDRDAAYCHRDGSGGRAVVGEVLERRGEEKVKRCKGNRERKLEKGSEDRGVLKRGAGSGRVRANSQGVVLLWCAAQQTRYQ
jgi:hypothetical protein